jgi:hypothetical protein
MNNEIRNKIGEIKITMKKNKLFNWSNTYPKFSNKSLLKYNLHKILYNNKEKVHLFDKERFEELQRILSSPNIDDLHLGALLVKHGKFTPKQCSILEDKYYKISQYIDEQGNSSYIKEDNF